MVASLSTKTVRQSFPISTLGAVVSQALFGIVHLLERGSSENHCLKLTEQRVIATRANIAVTQDSVNLLAGCFAGAPSGSSSPKNFELMIAAPSATFVVFCPLAALVIPLAVALLSTAFISYPSSKSPHPVDLNRMTDMVEVSAANLMQMFEIFFSTKVSGQGTGWGGAISRTIDHCHGSHISAESQPGSRACFRIRLQLAPIQGD